MPGAQSREKLIFDPECFFEIDHLSWTGPGLPAGLHREAYVQAVNELKIYYTPGSVFVYCPFTVLSSSDHANGNNESRKKAVPNWPLSEIPDPVGKIRRGNATAHSVSFFLLVSSVIIDNLNIEEIVAFGPKQIRL